MNEISRREMILGTVFGAFALAACASSDDARGGGATTVATTAASGAGATTTASTAAPTGGTPTGTIRAAAYLSPPSLDAHAMALGQPIQLSQCVYDTLIRKLPDGTYVPMLATKWGFVDNNPLLFEMTLRTDVDFTDGAHFNAAAVKANIERFQALPAGLNTVVANVQSVEAVDESTVRFHLSAPMPAILLTLSTNPSGAMISPKAFENKDLSTNPVGSGPYTFDTKSFVEGSFYAFDTRKGYWDPSLQKLARIEFTVMAEVEARYNAIIAGQTDMAPSDASRVESAKAAGLAVVTNPVDWWGLVLFDRDGKISKPLGDVKVRQAMNHAVDRDAILKTVALGVGHVTTQIYPRNSQAYVNALDTRYPYDTAKAKDLLSQAGYADGFEFDTPAIADSTYLEALAGYLAEVGIKMKLNVVDGNAYVEEFISGKYPAAFFTFGSEFPSQDNANMLLPNASLNVLHTTDQQVIDLDAEASKASGDQQVKLWQQINTRITEQAWFLVTHAADSVLLVNPKVTGTTPYVNQDSLSIYEWDIQE